MIGSLSLGTKPTWQLGTTMVSGLAAAYLCGVLAVSRETITDPAFAFAIGHAPYLVALAVVARAAAWSSGSSRVGFVALAVFVGLWEAASWLQVIEGVPFAEESAPQAAAIMVFAGYGCALLAAIRLAPPYALTDPRRSLETAAVLVIAGAVLLEYVVPDQSPSGLNTATAMGYPLFDAVLLTLVVLSFFGESPEGRARAVLLGATFGSLFLIDTVALGDRSMGSAPAAVLELAHDSAILLLALAAVSDANLGLNLRAPTSRLLVFGQSALPFGLIAPPAIAVTVHAFIGETVPSLTLGTFFAATLLLGRQWLVAADNRALYAHRARLVTSFDAKTREAEREVVERRRAEVALRREEERFRAVAEHLDEGLLLANPAGRIVYANPRMAHLVGYNRSDFMGRRAQDVLEPWEDWEPLLEGDGPAKGDLGRREIPSVTFDGEPVWLEGYSRSFHPGSDDATVIAIAIDVTDRKLGEEDAIARAMDLSRHNEALERLSSSTTFDGGGLQPAISEIATVGALSMRVASLSVWLIDETDRTLRLFARSPDVAAADCESAIALDDCPHYLWSLSTDGSIAASDTQHDPRVSELLESTLEPAGVTASLDVPVRLVGQTVGVIRCEHTGSPHIWTAAEQSLGASLAGFMATVLEANRRQKALDSRARLAAVVNATPDIVSIFDTAGTAIYLNDSARRVLGLGNTAEPSEVRMESFFTGHAVADLREKALPSALSAGSWSGETTVRTADGGRMPVSQVILAHSEDGEPQYIGTIMRDLTDAHKAAEEKENLNRKLQEAHKLESLGLLAGGIAHDFNNLLQAILGNAQLARMTISPDVEAAHESLSELERASRTAADLVRQLLAFAGTGQTGLAPTDPSALVEDTVRLLLATVTKHATVNLKLSPALPKIDADSVQLRQVVMNLVTNAADAIGPNDGVIDVRTTTLQVSRQYLRDCFLGENLMPDEYVAIEVRDTGSGMDRATVARIFDPFFTTKNYGHGLGLASVLGTVRSHRGALRVVSRPGQGTVFTVLLPPLTGEEHERPVPGEAAAA